MGIKLHEQAMANAVERYKSFHYQMYGRSEAADGGEIQDQPGFVAVSGGAKVSRAANISHLVNLTCFFPQDFAPLGCAQFCGGLLPPHLDGEQSGMIGQGWLSGAMGDGVWFLVALHLFAIC